MSFQKCPKCNGEGSMPPTAWTVGVRELCNVCFGEKIIHEEQGVPPSKVKQFKPVLRECDIKPSRACDCEVGTCLMVNKCDHSKPKAS
jgi:hypothetical protein